MVSFKQKPDTGELVICTVKDINPNSVYVNLVEYDYRGMIHVSEVSNSWVRDIRKAVKPDQTIVCLVRNNRGEILSLSIKRVKPTQKRAKITEWKNEKKAENILKFIAEKLGIDMDGAYEKIGYPIMERYGNMYSVFLRAVKDGKNVFDEFGFDKKTVDAIYYFVEKNIKVKEVLRKRRIELFCFDSDGVEKIKKILTFKDSKFDVKFISSSVYEFSVSSLDVVECDKLLDSAVSAVEKNISNFKADCVFKVCV